MSVMPYSFSTNSVKNDPIAIHWNALPSSRGFIMSIVASISIMPRKINQAKYTAQ
jgi:hypothetical protein